MQILDAFFCRFRCTNPYSFHDRADLFPLPSMIAYAAAEIYDVNYSEVIECPLINGGFLFLPESMFNAKKVVQEMKVSKSMEPQIITFSHFPS